MVGQQHSHSEHPEEVPSVEELMIPPLSVGEYLRFGFGMLGRTRELHGVRAIRSLLSFAASSAPIMLIGVLAWIFGSTAGPPNASQPTVPDALVLDGASIVLALTAIIAVIFGRSICDAAIFGAYRDATGDGTRVTERWYRRTIPGYATVILLQLGLLAGTTMYVAPAATRIVRGIAESPSGLSHPAIPIAVFVFCWIIIAVRFVTMIVPAYLTWRPDFVAGSIFAAIGVPLRNLRISLSFLGFWTSTFGLLVFSLAWIALHAMVRFMDDALVLTAVEVGAIAVVWLCMSIVDHWMDATLVAMVGHRIGMIPTRAVEENEPSASTTSLDDQRIESYPRGFFRRYDPAEDGDLLFTFESLLGYRPVNGDRERWLVPEELGDIGVIGAGWSASGALEVSVTNSASHLVGGGSSGGQQSTNDGDDSVT
jgi:hypothetical protein